MEKLDIANLDIAVRLKMVERILGCELDKLDGGQDELGEALLGACEIIGDCVVMLESR